MIIVLKKGHTEKMYRQNEYDIFKKKPSTWVNNFTIGHMGTFLLRVTELLRPFDIEIILTNKLLSTHSMLTNQC